MVRQKAEQMKSTQMRLIENPQEVEVPPSYGWKDVWLLRSAPSKGKLNRYCGYRVNRNLAG